MIVNKGGYFPDNIGDTRKAITYYQKACDLHNGYACNMIAIAYDSGMYFKKNDVTAWEYYKKACRYHDDNACKVVEKYKAY